MKTRLFDENERYTKEAFELDKSIMDAIGPIFYKYVEAGYSVRDIGLVMEMACVDFMLTKLF